LTDEFQIGAHHYLVGRLDARRQFDVARRLGYVLTMLGAEKSAEFKPTPENFARIILVTAGQVPQADMDTALNICLGVVKRKITGDVGWASVTTQKGDALMFDDIDMPIMLQLVWHVVSAHRMVDFLSVSGRSSGEPKSRD
jgi:hypothetical protein